jgi:hypothetical protein
MFKRIALVLAAAVTAVTAAGGLAQAAASYQPEFTNAATNPVAGYLVQYTKPDQRGFNEVTTSIGDTYSNSSALSLLPADANHGIGTELCDPSTGAAIQVGVVNNGNAVGSADTYNVEWAAGYLSSVLSPPKTGVAYSESDPCLNGVLGDKFLTSPAGPQLLIASIPVQDNVNVSIARVGGHWVVSANVRGGPVSFNGGLQARTASTSFYFNQHFNEAAFGAEANPGQSLQPLADGAVAVGAQAHMRAIYGTVVQHGHQGGAPTLDAFPSAFGKVIFVSSTLNGDPGGTVYAAPTLLHNDAFEAHEGQTNLG